MQTGQRMPLTTTMQVKGGAAKQEDTEADLGITCQPCRERDGGAATPSGPNSQLLVSQKNCQQSLHLAAGLTMME